MTDETATPDPPNKRSTAATVARRVEEVLRLRLDGANFAQLREYAGENGWGISDSMLRKYIEKANDLLKERDERGRSHTIRLHLARRESLYARAVQSGDHRTALAVLDSSAKLRGLGVDESDIKRAELLEKEIPALLDLIRALAPDGDREETGPLARLAAVLTPKQRRLLVRQLAEGDPDEDPEDAGTKADDHADGR